MILSTDFVMRKSCNSPGANTHHMTQQQAAFVKIVQKI